MKKSNMRKIVRTTDEGDYQFNCPQKHGAECWAGYGDFHYVTDDPYPMGQNFCEGNCPRMKYFEKMRRKYVKRKERTI